MSKVAKKRYSIPGKIIDLLWTDDEVFSEISKLKKYSAASFPRNDQEVDRENGFIMHFALAGYSPESISVKTEGPYLFVSSNEVKEVEDVDSKVKASISNGFFSRGIAKRNFDVKYLISEEFDVNNVTAEMEHGLLKITIPHRLVESKTFKVKTSNNS